MAQKAFAIVAAGTLIAALLTAPVGAQGSSQPISTSSCSTADLNDIVAVYNFDSPAYKSAPAPVPAGVKAYLAQLLVGRLQTCVPHAGPAGAAACTPPPLEADPRALWRQLKFCEGIIGLQHPAKSQEPLLLAQEPTFYVLLSIGAGSGGAPGGQTPGGGKGGGGGAATGSTATGSSVDNPAYFLLYTVAQRLEHDVCLRSHIAVSACAAQHPVAVVPESTWNLEDFRTQCLDDPYVPNDPSNPYGLVGEQTQAGRGTLGAIVLNGSTVTADGTFAIFTVYGSSEANFNAQVVDCGASTTRLPSTVWSDNISNGNKTTALSFFPIALAGTLLAAGAAGRAASQPAPSASSSPSQQSAFINYETDVALGTFFANSSTLTLGNPSSGLTFHHTFEAWSNSLARDLNAFCKLQPAQNVCRALKLPT